MTKQDLPKQSFRDFPDHEFLSLLVTPSHDSSLFTSTKERVIFKCNLSAAVDWSITETVIKKSLLGKCGYANIHESPLRATVTANYRTLSLKHDSNCVFLFSKLKAILQAQTWTKRAINLSTCKKNVCCESQHNRSEHFAIKPDLSELNLASIHRGFTWNLNLCDEDKHHFLCLNASISINEHVVKGVEVFGSFRTPTTFSSLKKDLFPGYTLV